MGLERFMREWTNCKAQGGRAMSSGPPGKIWLDWSKEHGVVAMPDEVSLEGDYHGETDEPYHHQRTVDKLVAGLLAVEQEDYRAYDEALELAKQLKETSND